MIELSTSTLQDLIILAVSPFCKSLVKRSLAECVHCFNCQLALFEADGYQCILFLFLYELNRLAVRVFADTVRTSYNFTYKFRNLDIVWQYDDGTADF